MSENLEGKQDNSSGKRWETIDQLRVSASKFGKPCVPDLSMQQFEEASAPQRLRREPNDQNSLKKKIAQKNTCA